MDNQDIRQTPDRAELLVEPGEAFMQLEGHRRTRSADDDRLDVIVIGAGQAGLVTGYHLKRRGLRFVILDGGERIGDPWRQRWDSLRLFTPARYDGLSGMPFPAPPNVFPTKDEMGDYLEAYAARFQLPVRLRSKVERLSRRDGGYLVQGNGFELRADHVVVAMSSYQRPRIPAFGRELRPDIVQLHSLDYRNGAQLGARRVLVVGAGNSGAEIAIEAARNHHETWLSGRNTGNVPFDIESKASQLVLSRLVIGFAFHHLLTVNTPLGRKVRPHVISRGAPLIRLKPRDISAAGVKRTGKVTGVRDGLPVLEDGSTLDVGTVVWCTGFDHGLEWIDLPIIGDDGEPRHKSGIAIDEPGLYYVGQHFLHSFSSTMIRGVSRDGSRVAKTIARRVRAVARQQPSVTAY